jgi:4'-phosphopantetheinyl transferase
VRSLRALPAEEQHRGFLAHWTLKESYVKARGLGLALPLDQFSFVHDEAAPHIVFDPRLADVAANWRFALVDALPRHLVAVGMDTGGAALSLRGTPIGGI